VGHGRRHHHRHQRLLEDGRYQTALVGTACERLGRRRNGRGRCQPESDDDFVRDIAIKNMAEVELSRMALDKATNPDIKAFAQRIIDEHDMAGHKLRSVVSGQAIEWPPQLDDKHKKTADELARKQGASFERDYVKAMVDGHQDLAAKLESRLDVQSLADWKTAAAGRADSKTLPQPKIALRDVQVRPNKSDNEVTMRIQPVGGRDVPRRANAPRHRQNA
jgi:predicted outer membrane protein